MKIFPKWFNKNKNISNNMEFTAFIELFITLLIKLKITPQEIVDALDSELDLEAILKYKKELVIALVDKLINTAPDRATLDGIVNLKEKLTKLF